MLPGIPRYLYLFTQKTILCFFLLITVTSLSQAQNEPAAANASSRRLSPLLVSAFKKQVRPAANLNERFKIPGNQLMYWPDYPLTYAQIEARNREWERKNNQSLGEQIASDIIKNQVNSLIYGKKHTAATIPKF